MKTTILMMTMALASCATPTKTHEGRMTHVLSSREERSIADYIVKHNQKVSAAEASHIASVITAASLKHRVPTHLILAVVKVESNFKHDAKSHVGARGMMQLMKGTARMLGVTDVLNVAQNVDGGTAYLRILLDKFDQRVDLALAAYNAGPAGWRRGLGYSRKVLQTNKDILDSLPVYNRSSL